MSWVPLDPPLPPSVQFMETVLIQVNLDLKNHKMCSTLVALPSGGSGGIKVKRNPRVKRHRVWFKRKCQPHTFLGLHKGKPEMWSRGAS